MGVFKLDPPPNTDDVTILRKYINDMYDAIRNVIYNIDKDNLSEEFINNLNINEEE